MSSPDTADATADVLTSTLQLDDAASRKTQLNKWCAEPLAEGCTWYAVPKLWIDAWVDAQTTGALDTTSIADDGALRTDANYVLVPEHAWTALTAHTEVVGPTLALPVIPACGTQPAFVETQLPVFSISRLVGSATPAPGTPTQISMSASATVAQLKARIRALRLVMPTTAESDCRLLRISSDISRAALTPAQLSNTSVSVIDAGEERVYRPDAPLYSLGLAISTSLAIDVRVGGSWLWGSTKRDSARARGTRGLMNLGNTCFMNSALQCLSNTPELQQYFFSGAYASELNKTNPLGMGGAIAGAYGRLVHQLWAAASGAVVPRDFKMALARFAPQFTGYAQQDSQELLAFLLDGLHEDLNRIAKKPYIETPDWEGGSAGDMLRFASKQWDLYKARNDSVIVDLFQGQYRSTLVCPVCSKISIKFDPFMYLTLPIPNTRKWRGRVHVVPRDGPIVQADIQLPATASVAQLRERAASLARVPAENLVIGEVWSHRAYRWIADYENVHDISAGDHIYLWDTGAPFTLPRPLKALDGMHRGLFARMHRAVPDVESSHEPPAKGDATVPVYSSIAPVSGSFRRMFGDAFGLPLFVTIPADRVSDAQYCMDAVAREFIRFSRNPADSVEEFYARAEKAKEAAAEEANQDAGAADEHAAPENNAPSSSAPFTLRFAPQAADEPIARGDDATEQSTEDLNERITRLGAHSEWPVLYTGCSLMCSWDAAVAHALFDAVPSSHAWGPVEATQDDDFQRGTADVKRRGAPARLTLDECLDEFTREEQLGENDPWYCPECREFRQATKKFDLWKVPDILVVHLKRFAAGRMTRDKLDTYVDFPLQGLDLSGRVESAATFERAKTDPARPSDPKLDRFDVVHDTHDDEVMSDKPIYDLYAVDNHFGGLGGGHYTAFARNAEDRQWYNYDDSSVRPVSNPESVKSSAAYLLFYRRRTTRPIGGKSRDRIKEAASGPPHEPPSPLTPEEAAPAYSDLESEPDWGSGPGQYLRGVPLPSSDSEDEASVADALAL
ncbi:ubiquitinyl hydrolase 1 [Malassezia cuniculi]|uniref:ubiquitinyl hydrolase 1 n=1 Tax=Malassezia cuniculi TaxID=948313 RepID=A0AAF0EVF9_9BASI|nr:ubiquitinyl hydrolase 1 [Malassezia cuniculi]